jgi:hypothetical protein
MASILTNDVGCSKVNDQCYLWPLIDVRRLSRGTYMILANHVPLPSYPGDPAWSHFDIRLFVE